MNPCINIFCQPTPEQVDVSLTQPVNTLQWSADGVTWADLPNPTATALYWRWISDAALVDGNIYFQSGGGGGYDIPATASGNVLTTSATVAVAGADYELSVNGTDIGPVTIS